LQRDQHLPFPFNSGLLDVGGVALLLDFPNLILDLFEPGIFPFQLPPQPIGQWVTFRGFQRREVDFD
jgi:hypothetical protein